MLDRAVPVQLIEIQTSYPARIDLTFRAQSESSENINEGVADEGPETRRLRGVLVLEVRGGCEDLAHCDADADFGHGGAHFRCLDVAAVAGDVAMVGEGIDDGAGAADVGG